MVKEQQFDPSALIDQYLEQLLPDLIKTWTTFLPEGWGTPELHFADDGLQVWIRREDGLHAAPSQGALAVLMPALAMALFHDVPGLHIAVVEDRALTPELLAAALPGWAKYPGQVIVPSVVTPKGKGRYGFEQVVLGEKKEASEG